MPRWRRRGRARRRPRRRRRPRPIAAPERGLRGPGALGQRAGLARRVGRASATSGCGGRRPRRSGDGHAGPQDVQGDGLARLQHPLAALLAERDAAAAEDRRGVGVEVEDHAGVLVDAEHERAGGQLPLEPLQPGQTEVAEAGVVVAALGVVEVGDDGDGQPERASAGRGRPTRRGRRRPCRSRRRARWRRPTSGRPRSRTPTPRRYRRAAGGRPARRARAFPPTGGARTTGCRDR